jgi:hypothetical protein
MATVRTQQQGPAITGPQPGRDTIMTSTPPTSHTPARWRAKATILATATAAALGLATIPALASAAPATVPTITSVTFSTGSAANSPTPLVTINGSGFGTLPNPSPGGDPQAAFSDCGSPSGYDGLDFASHLYFNNLTGPAGFEAGNGTSGNCIGLVIWEYTPTQIEYGFGSVYAGFTPGLQNGDRYSLHVKGASVTGTVTFTSSATH